MDRIRVGSFELYPTERRLCAAGRPVDIGPRAFDLLLVLVEKPGQLVTKATLIERVWPRVVVDENNLPAQIASLRRVLGAGSIRTVPRFGYRLDLEVSTPTVVDEVMPPAVAREPPRLNVPRRAWPNRLGSLVGREADVHAVRQALERTCLVTIIGTAGVGKTRLAQEILACHSEIPGAAVAWVSLEPLEEAEHLPSAIALALGLSLPDGADRFLALRRQVERTPLLLILDGAERLADALAPLLSKLILQTAAVRALVTSQTPLGVAGETLYRLSPLPVPEAVTLFVQRAAQADQRFELGSEQAPLAAEICRRLDGNPLAVELAAARVPALGLATLLARLDDRFRLLKHAGRNADPRHGVLQAAFDWSYGLLEDAEKRVFDRLGAFAASFSLHTAASAVADETIHTSDAIDLIGRLVDRSLVTILPTEPPRYTLLETARCYAVDHLAAGNQVPAARARMAAALLDLLDEAYEEYWSLDEAVWLNQYEAELDNVRAALEWASSEDKALAVSLYGSAWPLFVETDLHAEGRARHAEAIGLLTDGLPRNRLARFWEAIATYDATRQCDRACHAADLAASLHQATGDSRSRYYALMQFSLNSRDDDALARATFDAARLLEEPAWPARLLAHGAMAEGALLMAEGKLTEARTAYRRALSVALATSERQALAATVHIVELDIASGATADALQLGRPLSLSLQHSGRRETLFELLVMTFSALLIAGEIGEARAMGAQLFDLALRLDDSKLYTVLDAMAVLACRDGNYAAAARIGACADTAHLAHGQARRRPAQARLQSAMIEILEQQLGSGWGDSAGEGGAILNETSACRLALGLD
ncbi:MAG TPA: winged helix-turn-helix domain-containing protein [Steroidobacteraceae bacterium]|nr:winged helix-turn-helix domain-containing protein [Steroidobacteraceae bacterium]